MGFLDAGGSDRLSNVIVGGQKGKRWPTQNVNVIAKKLIKSSQTVE